MTLRGVLAVARLGAAVAGLLAFLLPPLVVMRAAGRAAAGVPLIFHRGLCRALGVRRIVLGAPVTDRPVVFVANHVSWLDIPCLGAVAPMAFVAKSEVAAWPVIGGLALLQPSLFIDRSARHRAGAQAKALARLLRPGRPVVLFAEGTSSDGRAVLPFRSSLLAGAEGALVQPVTIAYLTVGGRPVRGADRDSVAYYGDMTLLPHVARLAGAGDIEVCLVFHPPFEAAGDRKAIARRAQAVVAAGLAALTSDQVPVSSLNRAA